MKYSSFIFWILLLPIALSAIIWWTLPPLPEYAKDYDTTMRLNLHFLRHRSKITIPLAFLLSKLGMGDLFALDRTLLTRFYSLLFHPLKADDEEIQSTDTNFDGIPVRIYIPTKLRQSKEPGPAILYIHGGGWSIMSYEYHDHPVRSLARALNIVIVSINYRLAPENVYPAQLDDCETALRHLMLNAQKWNVDSGRIAVSGDSAGGHLSTTLSLRWRHILAKQISTKSTMQHLKPIRLQILIYPAVQTVNISLNSVFANQNDPILPRAAAFVYLCFVHGAPTCLEPAIRAAWLAGNFTTSKTRMTLDQYFRYDRLPSDLSALIPQIDREVGARARNDPNEMHPIGDSELEQKYIDGGPMLTEEVSPLFASDEALRALPPTYIAVMNHDVIRDDNIFFVARLRELKVPVHLQYYPGHFHGLFNVKPEIIISDIKAYLEKTNLL